MSIAQVQIEIGGVDVTALYRWPADSSDPADIAVEGLQVAGVDIADALVSVVTRTARLARGERCHMIRDAEVVLWDEVANKIAAAAAAESVAERAALAHDQAYGA